MTEATYRKKALSHLLKDFEGRCAYCLDPSDFRHPSQNHVEHFNCKLRPRKRHQYKNLMLGCATCNLCKHDKPVINKYDKRQRLLNCTEESEFPTHIMEDESGRWLPLTPEGLYHLTVIGLDEPCQQKKRELRLELAKDLLRLYTTAIQYQGQNPIELHQTIMETVRDILNRLSAFPPLITENGVLSVRQWLEKQGVTL